MKFTPCQAKALHLLNSKANIFLTGAAGTGKSFLLQQYLSGKGRKEYPILASTGAAAMIVEGRTFHSFFGLGILEGGMQATIARAMLSKPLLTRLQRAECIVIDEVSMLSGETLATAEAIAKRVRGNSEPWGGLRIITVGDFAQLPPVQPRQQVDMGDEPRSDWAFLHPVWEESNFQAAYLQTTMRTNEPRLLNVLNNVRQGIVNEEVTEFLNGRMTPSSTTFDGTRLFPHRASADRYNMERLENLAGDARIFPTVYDGQEPYVSQLKKQCPIPESLHLKKGALIMFRKNDTAFPYTYVNGSLGTIVEMSDDILTIRLMHGERIDIGQEEFSALDGNGSVRAKARNFPITLAWATTIHKAQGSSIDRLMVSMQSLWESGHAYVALSRARSEEGLFIENWDAKNIFVDDAVQTFYSGIRTEWSRTSANLPEETVQEPKAIEKHVVHSKQSTTPNHLLSEALIKEQKSLADIAAALGWTEGTIIGHIEKLVEEGRNPPIEYLRPSSQSFDNIKMMFRIHGTDALKPVHTAFDGRYSYDVIKLVRVFLLQEQKIMAVSA